MYKKSNFVRAFDRRPSGVEDMVQMRAQAAPDDGATAFHQSPSAGEITCSHDSSTSGHHGQPLQTGEISDMAIDNEPIWEWEQLDQYWSRQGHSDQQWKNHIWVAEEKEVLVYYLYIYIWKTNNTPGFHLHTEQTSELGQNFFLLWLFFSFFSFLVQYRGICNDWNVAVSATYTV